MSKFEKLNVEVQSLYSEMDKESTEYQKNNQLNCQSKCNHCCKNPSVSATPLEMLPIALELIQSNKIPSDSQLNKATCLFSTAQCSIYSKRPTVCRLFGWSLVSGKNGKRLSVCPKVLGSNQSLPLDAPNIELFASRVKDLDPTLGTQILPINEALKTIINHIQMTNYFAE